MSPIEMITEALAAGAGSVKNTDVQDEHAWLKALLRLRLDGQDFRVISSLDEDRIDARLWRERIGDALIESGAAEDAQVLEAARRLLAIVQRP